MVNTRIVSPYLAAPQGSAKMPPIAGTPAAPADVMDTAAAEPAKTSSLGKFAKIGGALLLAGTAVAGVAALAPKAADALPSKASVMQTQWRGGGHYRHGYGGWGWGYGPRYYAPPVIPIYPPVVPVYPVIPVVPVTPYPYGGFNGVGCDGVAHHFDANGHVFDRSGHYQLVPNGWGGCYRNYNVIN